MLYFPCLSGGECVGLCSSKVFTSGPEKGEDCSRTNLGTSCSLEGSLLGLLSICPNLAAIVSANSFNKSNNSIKSTSSGNFVAGVHTPRRSLANYQL